MKATRYVFDVRVQILCYHALITLIFSAESNILMSLGLLAHLNILIL